MFRSIIVLSHNNQSHRRSIQGKIPNLDNAGRFEELLNVLHAFLGTPPINCQGRHAAASHCSFDLLHKPPGKQGSSETCAEAEIENSVKKWEVVWVSTLDERREVDDLYPSNVNNAGILEREDLVASAGGNAKDV